MSSESVPPKPLQEADLVAYLDGELTPAQEARVSDLVERDPATRRELERLKHAWGLLDHLDRPLISADRTEHTLTIAAAAQARSSSRATALFAVRALGLVALSACAGWFGYTLAHAPRAESSQRLERDLSIAENLDAYIAVESFEFLQALARSQRAFPENEP